MMGYGDKPFGLREITLVPRVTTPTAVTLPIARQMMIRPRISAAELKGDDVIAAERAHVEGAEWSLEAGGISLEAYAVMMGITPATSGTTPARTLTTTVTGGANLPYFKIYGKAESDDGSNIHAKIFKAKVTSIEGTFGVDAFYITQCSGIAVADVDDDNNIYEFVQNETSAALPTT